MGGMKTKFKITNASNGSVLPTVPYKTKWLNKGGSISYDALILKLFGSSIVAYWKMNEAAGTTAEDSGANNADATYVNGPTLNSALCGLTGTNCPSFDGGNDYLNGASAAFSAAYGLGAAGSCMVIARVSAAGDWTDAANRALFYLAHADGDYAYVIKSSTNNRLTLRVRAAGVGNATDYDLVSPPTVWFSVALTWESNVVYRAYYNGAQVGVDQAIGIINSAPAANNPIVAAVSTTPSQPWKGWIGHVVWLNRVATLPEIASYHTLGVG